ncbi:MAG: SAM-dependent methyltransferase, partial [Vicinamibacteria bacterium]|nr:SAM-dependent methyltransferase [Vicinamibacteria bacterium]
MAAEDDAALLTLRLRQSTLGWFDVLTLYVGQKLGFYATLAADGPLDAAGLARRTGTHPRYVREWLEQQAASGLLIVDDPAAAPERRRYALPAGHARVLVERDDPLWQGDRPLSLLPLARQMPQLLAAFRDGGGIASADHDDDSRRAQASLGRVDYLRSMATWIGAVPELDARLRREPPARIADLGCGAGWSAIALAGAYPSA